MKSLPARPSLDSLRKQAKKLARDVAAGDAGAIARARAQLSTLDLPLTLRDAQLVIAREYGYAGWQELGAEVKARVGDSLDPTIRKARRAIHENDVERLSQLLAENPGLLSWEGGETHGGLLGYATSAYGDAFGEERERWFTRAACAELLIAAGAVVTPAVVDGLLYSRAKGLLDLFRRKGLLPHTLRFLAAIGDDDAVRTALESEHDRATVTAAFIMACRFEHRHVASTLLEHAVALDPELANAVDGAGGGAEFIDALIEMRPELDDALVVGPRQAFIMGRVRRALRRRDLTTFIQLLERERVLLGKNFLWFQKRLVEDAALKGNAEFIVALLELKPALVGGGQPAPSSQAFEFALTYGHSDLIPLLTRIWPIPNDLAHAAGMGDLPRVKSWFDETGKPALGDLEKHFPFTDARARDDLHWNPITPQHVLDTALAFAVINHHFDVADFLLDHGANINTNWNSHEPASILHHLVFEDDYDSMQYLIDHGIDLTIKDYRWNSTARGWALHAKKDQRMADWLEQAERRREASGVR